MRNSNYKERISDIINITNFPFWDKIANFSNSNEFTNISDFHYMINMNNINNRCKCNNIINDHMCLNSGNYFNDTCIFNKDKIGMKKRKLFENNQHEYNLNKSNTHLRSSSFIYNNKYTPKFYTNNELSPNNKYINYNDDDDDVDDDVDDVDDDDDSISIKHIKRHVNNIGKNKNIYRKPNNSDIDENINKIKNKYTKSVESNSTMDYEINTKHKKSCKRINSDFSDNNWINKENYRNANKSNIEMMGKNKKDEYFVNNNEKYTQEYGGRKKIKRRKIVDKNGSPLDKNVKNKQYDPKYDPKYDSKYDPKYDSKYDPKYDSKYDPQYDSKYDCQYEINKRDSNPNHILTPICNKVPMKNEFYSEEEKQEFDNINIIQRINKDFCYLNNNDKINVIKILCSYRAYLKKILNYEYMKQDFSFEVETCIFYLDYINYNKKNRNNRKDYISDKMNNQYDNNYSSTNSNVDENNRNINTRSRHNNVYYDIDSYTNTLLFYDKHMGLNGNFYLLL
ncbi:protein serine/threonine kinase-1 [Plasmodium yoelii yoelii]|uniref:Protein serine/threonine kinase-1 n=1 Tax=Plasmodium yoelii yoelii TaxID=73239 RepID=Q7RKP7_PLAYO|nr:protein serine/threonine kinase-1 [Plasmodium yoelii yoelii]